jgi:hypothetical protein
VSDDHQFDGARGALYGRPTRHGARARVRFAAAITGDAAMILARLADQVRRGRRAARNSPHLEGFRARGVEVLYLPDPVDNFWATSAPSFEGKPFKSVTQGAADLSTILQVDAKEQAGAATDVAITDFIAFTRATLGEAVADVRVESPRSVC